MNLRLPASLTFAITAFGLAGAQFDNGASTAAKSNNPAFTVELKAKVMEGVKQIVTQRAFVPGIDFSGWDAMVAKHQEAIDKTQDEAAFIREVNTTLREFGITHIGLRSPRAAQARRTGTTTGLGLTAQPKEDGLAVTVVTPESPAAKAGIAAGDTIILINGEPAKSLDALPRQPGQEATLKLRRANGTEAEVKLGVGEFRPPTRDSVRWVDDKTAVIRINSFANGYERDKVKEFMTESAKASYLIVDLRNNGGGAVTNLANLLGYFVASSEPVGTFVNRTTVTEFEKATGNKGANLAEIAKWATNKYRPSKPELPVFAGKLAVLVNRGSASASEIFAAAVRDTIGAKIVGADTRGAVLASTYGRLEGGFEIQYPVSDYVTITGARLEGNPVKPDIAVDQGRPEPGKDPTLEAAMAALKG